MSPPSDLTDKDALIAALMARIEVLLAQIDTLSKQNAGLVARVVELEVKLGLPPKLALGLDPRDAGQFEPSALEGPEALRFDAAEAKSQAASRRPPGASSEPDPHARGPWP